ncbi:DUF1841 family protein [Imhoffiella purpurea]|uniref:DUF1841 domain-containing protein n=1 Tax=Imhoffiella purpurea TaxID=1249627 RepID=W9VGN3_9GAMM|nr:DUF1841 family protein [Imhoffiella purpurea]EXJ15197.1 hypothetical protein D779_1495 [Imhoffiella purpurea]
MLSADRQTHRRIFIQAWRKARQSEPLEPLERQIVEILQRHPEYQGLLETEDATLDKDFLPQQGETNPFLHLGLHLAILEQISIDQPAGIRQGYLDLAQGLGDAHQAEHRIMECLANALWRLQHDQGPFDEGDYLACIAAAKSRKHP